MTLPLRFHPDARPLILTGAPRSGTTFLTVVMNQHPQILLTNELRPWSFVNNVRLRLKKPSELLPEHPLRDPFASALIDNMTGLIEHFYRTEVPRSELANGDMTNASVDPAIRAYGDKNPSYADPNEVGCAGFIARAWKNSRFVHIHRDPRSCAASYKAVKVYSDEITRGVSIWRRHIEKMCDLAKDLGPGRVMTIRYEDLVGPEGPGIFRELETFLELDAASEPVNFLEKERTRRTPFRAPSTPQRLLGQTSYEERLSEQDIGYVEHACRDLMEAFGYEPSLPTDQAARLAQAAEAAAGTGGKTSGLPADSSAK